MTILIDNSFFFFQMILEGERSVDSAKALVESAESKEIKLRKDHKKLLKKRYLFYIQLFVGDSWLELIDYSSCPPSDQIKEIEDKLVKINLDKDYAESEANIKVKDHEVVL